MTESPFKPLSAYEERDAEWLIPGWIPKGSIGTLASDGGIGKTSVWCSLVADISAGRPCFLDPPNHHREPETVAFLSAEDSVQAKLARKIRLAGGDMSRILTPDLMRDAGQLMQRMKFGSSELVSFIKAVKPGIVVFDPLQGFVPPEVNMSARNAMRNCLAPLTALGEETGTSFLIVAHSNKRKGAWGRDRIADSADLWDISRSVLMAGIADETGQRYLSQEKSNYGILQKTVLFSVGDEGQISLTGTTWKRDRDFMLEAAQSIKTAREDCRTFVLRQLADHGGEMLTADLEAAAKAEGFSSRTLRRAKDELKQDGETAYRQKQCNGERAWYIYSLKLSAA